jgi:glycosyltransferase involved in cell wall biosynthesis
MSPYNQNLPNCLSQAAKKSYVYKKTTAKAVLCPMIKDEQGFLSEWVAYYQMHGFDHVVVFDDGSIDDGLKELENWIKSDFVTIVRNWTTDSLNIHPGYMKQVYRKNMAIKAALERECKKRAYDMGFNLSVSLDLDEYIIPKNLSLTVVDDIMEWIEATGRPSLCMSKLNFPSVPHLLEPINLLTIEAYQTRMKNPAKMNYYTSVAPKCAYALRHPEFTNDTSEFVIRCCHFHGCEHHDIEKGSRFCAQNFGNEAWKIAGKGKRWLDGATINHYSRSVEKYAFKAKTWKTASGEVKKGETSEAVARSYDISKFLARSTGWYHDNTALRYSCQLRELLRNVTKDEFYLRPGLFWYRNPEFGKEIADENKRGRFGRPNPPGFKFDDGNPFLYKGYFEGYHKPDV